MTTTFVRAAAAAERRTRARASQSSSLVFGAPGVPGAPGAGAARARGRRRGRLIGAEDAGGVRGEDGACIRTLRRSGAWNAVVPIEERVRRGAGPLKALMTIEARADEGFLEARGRARLRQERALMAYCWRRDQATAELVAGSE